MGSTLCPPCISLLWGLHIEGHDRVFLCPAPQEQVQGGRRAGSQLEAAWLALTLACPLPTRVGLVHSGANLSKYGPQHGGARITHGSPGTAGRPALQLR